LVLATHLITLILVKHSYFGFGILALLGVGRNPRDSPIEVKGLVGEVRGSLRPLLLLEVDAVHSPIIAVINREVVPINDLVVGLP